MVQFCTPTSASAATMVDTTVAVSAKEQSDDNAKKGFCAAEMNKAPDKEKALADDVNDIGADINEKSNRIATYASEIKALPQDSADLDMSVAQATERRLA